MCARGEGGAEEEEVVSVGRFSGLKQKEIVEGPGEKLKRAGTSKHGE